MVPVMIITEQLGILKRSRSISGYHPSRLIGLDRLAARCQHPVTFSLRCLQVVNSSAMRCFFIRQPQEQIIEKFGCFQAEIVKVAGSVDRCNVYQGHQFAIWVDKLGDAGGFGQHVRLRVRLVISFLN